MRYGLGRTIRRRPCAETLLDDMNAIPVSINPARTKPPILRKYFPLIKNLLVPRSVRRFTTKSSCIGSTCRYVAGCDQLVKHRPAHRTDSPADSLFCAGSDAKQFAGLAICSFGRAPRKFASWEGGLAPAQD